MFVLKKESRTGLVVARYVRTCTKNSALFELLVVRTAPLWSKKKSLTGLLVAIDMFVHAVIKRITYRVTSSHIFDDMFAHALVKKELRMELLVVRNTLTCAIVKNNDLYNYLPGY